MNQSICWAHIGDLHMDEADGFQSRARLDAIVSEINDNLSTQANFVYLPGDNANHGTKEQYDQILDGLVPLRTPWRMIPGDHDFEPGDLSIYRAAIPEANRPEAETIAGHRLIFLDLVSAGAGGPDFRLSAHHRHRLLREIAGARTKQLIPLVFMHAYPEDLSVDGDAVARAIAEGGVPFVDTGHTHYNELLNDGRTIYAATRSTGQIEEGDGRPGFSIVCVHKGVPSWRFKPLWGEWPFVQIVSPCDIRLITDPSNERHVPRPGYIRVVARRFGSSREPMVARVAGQAQREMVEDSQGLWRASIALAKPGLHRVTVNCGEASDVIEVLARDVDATPKRGLPVALGHTAHAIGAWPQAGLFGTQLGPNRNGCDW
jgi:hypothetical protein